MEFSELKNEIEKLKKQYNDLQLMINSFEENQNINDVEADYLKQLKEQRENIKKQLEELGLVVTTEIMNVDRNFDDPAKKDLSDREKELLRKCIEKLEVLKSFEYLDDQLENFVEYASQAIEKVENKENIKNREKGLEKLYNQLCIAITRAEELNKKESKVKDFFKKHWKKAGVIVLAIGLGIGIVKCDLDDKKEEQPDLDDTKKTEMIIDEESYQYFINKGVRESDAKELAENSANIDTLLAENGITDIKTNDVDELLYDVYEGHNITSSAENYDSLDTFTSLENVATTDVFNNLVGVPGFENIDYQKCANLLGFGDHLDINQDSRFDQCMEELSNAAQNYYTNVNSKEAAQNLIDVIYNVNKKSGKLNPSEEGMVTEYIMAVGPAASIMFPELTVSGTNITIDELINHIVAEIEVDCYTRTFN